MMNNLFKIAKKYPLTLICIVLICYLSIFLIPPKTALDDVAFIDKWTHLVMYGGTCAVFWWEYLRKNRNKASGWTFVVGCLPFIVGSGLIELIQEYCTTNRAGEWLDLAANATGAVTGTLIGRSLKKVEGS